MDSLPLWPKDLRLLQLHGTDDGLIPISIADVLAVKAKKTELNAVCARDMNDDNDDVLFVCIHLSLL